MKNLETVQWVDMVFGQCDLGDPRRLARLKDYAARQSEAPTASTFGACEGDVAATEGAYRFLRNKAVKAKNIDRGVALSTVELCKGRKTLLAIQDSTSVALAHVPLRDGLKEKGCPTGFMVHSTLMADGDTGEVIGLIDQVRWIRPKDRPDKSMRKERNYEDKESFRWEESSRRVAELLVDASNAITVCDREADIFDYLQYHLDNNSRFVMRASQDRALEKGVKLWQKMEDLPVVGYREIKIAQRGPWKPEFEKTREGRKARSARLELRAGVITLPFPSRQEIKESITVNVVYVKELNPPDGREPLIWRLFTSEPVDTLALVSRVVGFYEQRWLIEEFHKCWKVGCRLEERPFQSLDAVETLIAITAPIGARLLQFQCMADVSPDAPANKMLTLEELECLHAMTKPGTPMPKAPPTNKEVYHTIAKLGGWMDTKRTGRVGWQAIWKGWSRFQDRFFGWKLAKTAAGPSALYL